MKPLQPLKAAARAFFRDDLCLRREGGRLRIVFEGPRPAPTIEPGVGRAARIEQDLVEAMRRELGEALDEAPDTRDSVRHLVHFDRVLAASGLRALDQVQIEVLELAHGQLEALVSDWSPKALACLRSKMAVTLRGRRSGASAASA